MLLFVHLVHNLQILYFPHAVAAWAILASLWELFEAGTEGLSEAAEIRVAIHLGKGNWQLAKTSAYKSLIMTTICACIVTSIFFMCGEDLATWYTKDPTLQHMLNDLVPLLGVANITLTFGCVAWGLVGAQGRYRFGTFVSIVISWFFTMPAAALSCIVLKYDLKMIVGIIILGNATSSTILAYVLLVSDWEKLSNYIRGLHSGDGYGKDDLSDSDSSSSSDESSEDSSNDDTDSDVRSGMSQKMLVKRPLMM